jgi:hypothetical protein
MPCTPYESASLLLRLYELRREPTMREARNWFALEFHPNTFEEVVQTMMGPHSGHLRMVTSYWDMAASFVLNGAIDEKMFNDANGEQLGVFAKMEPFLGEYRARVGNPKYLSQLEEIVMRRPGATEQLASIREWFKARAATAATK